jgi:long-chain acyl-CoA synthetase
MTMTFDEAVAALTGPDGAFSVHEEVIEGVPQLVFDRTPPSLRELWATLRDRDPDGVFLVYEDERWTFPDVADRIDAVAALLVDRYGVAPGDRVAIAMRNYPEWVTSFAAVTSIGAIAVAMNAWWTTDELAYGLRDSGAKVLVADHERVERVLPLLAHDAVSAGPSGGHLDLQVVGVRLAGDLRHDRVDRLEDVLEPGAPMPVVEVAPAMDATILYTSGTTGEPKGAVSTHRAVLSALMAFACRSIVHAMVRGPVEPHPYPTCFILTVPLFHVTGLVPVMLGAVLGGNRLVMMYRWNPERALELVERERVTTFVGVPTMSWDLLESPDFPARDTSSLQSVGGGGAPAPPSWFAASTTASPGDGRASGTG